MKDYSSLIGKTIEVFTKKDVLFIMTFEDLVKNGFKASRIAKSIDLGISYRGMNYRIKLLTNKIN